MAEETQTQTQDQAVLPPIAPTANLDGPQILAMCKMYLANAEQTLTQIQKNKTQMLEQLEKTNKMELMVVGQREMMIAMISKITEVPETTQKPQ